MGPTRFGFFLDWFLLQPLVTLVSLLISRRRFDAASILLEICNVVIAKTKITVAQPKVCSISKRIDAASKRRRLISRLTSVT